MIIRSQSYKNKFRLKANLNNSRFLVGAVLCMITIELCYDK